MILTFLADGYYIGDMETLIVKVPDGTKERLRQVGSNISELIRTQIELLLEKANRGSVYDQARDLCGVIKGGPSDAATSKEYLKQYGKKRSA
jgi:hypothetical protein